MQTKELNIGEILIDNLKGYSDRIKAENAEYNKACGDVYFSCAKFLGNNTAKPVKIDEKHSMVILEEKDKTIKDLTYFCIYDKIGDELLDIDIVKIYEKAILFNAGYFETKNKNVQLEILKEEILPFLGVNFQEKPAKK